MSAKLAKQLLGKGKPEAPKASSPKAAPPRRLSVDEHPQEEVSPPQNGKEPARESRCRTEDMDDLQRYCHLNPPPPPPPQTDQPSPELSVEAKEFIEECNDASDDVTQRPPSPPSPATLLRPGAEEFINSCNEMEDTQPPPPPLPSPETTEETPPPPASVPEVSGNVSCLPEPPRTVLSEGKFFNSGISKDPPPPKDVSSQEPTRTVLSEGKFFNNKTNTAVEEAPVTAAPEVTEETSVKVAPVEVTPPHQQEPAEEAPKKLTPAEKLALSQARAQAASARRQGKPLSMDITPPPPKDDSNAASTSESSPSDGCNACDCNDFEPNSFKKGKCNNCFHFHDRRNSATSAACVPTTCQMEGLAQVCTQSPFKDGLCIDHYRLKKNHDHKFLNSDGQARLSNEKHCDQVNTKFMADKAYETTRDQMDDLKKQFIEMDEDGSGDINVLELGRAMEKLGKPKNQLQLRKMIAEVDISGSGTIEYDEFVLMMIGTSSSVLRLILLFEKKSQGEKQPPKGKKKPMVNLFA